MKLAKSLLLGSAAALSAVAGAQAADLPSRKAAPVEYVRVCSTYGAGFFYIPGTQTCLRIGGRARFEWQYSEPFSRNANTTGTRAIGRIYLDARTATEYGLLRTFIRYDVARRMGALASGTANRIGTGFAGTGVDYGAAQTQVALDRAFVQLGGLTAGRSGSFFDFYAADLELVATTLNAGGISTNLLAYTASFGGGFSATLSLEDPIERRNRIINAQAGAPVVVGFPNGLAANYAGAGMPDIVGVLRYDAGWGSAQLSGALHQVRTIGNLAVAGVVGTAIGYAPDTDYGFALNAGVKFNLPMLAPGDQLWLQGTYAKGATTYVTANACGQGQTGCFGANVGGALNLTDAVVINGGRGSLELTEAWGLTAAFLHYWTPTIRQGVFGSYGQINYSSGVKWAGNGYAGGFNGANGLKDSTYWTVGSNVIWSPVAGLDIGVEVDYVNFSVGGGGIFAAVPGNPTTLVRNDGDAWIGRFRIQRDF